MESSYFLKASEFERFLTSTSFVCRAREHRLSVNDRIRRSRQVRRILLWTFPRFETLGSFARILLPQVPKSTADSAQTINIRAVRFFVSCFLILHFCARFGSTRFQTRRRPRFHLICAGILRNSRLRVCLMFDLRLAGR